MVDPTTNPFTAVILALILGDANHLSIQWEKAPSAGKTPVAYFRNLPELSYQEVCMKLLLETKNDAAGFIEEWTKLASQPADFAKMQSQWSSLDQHLRLRTFIDGGHQFGPLDALVWGLLRGNQVFCKNFKDGKLVKDLPELCRWYAHVSEEPLVLEAGRLMAEQAAKLRERKKDQGSFEIDLPGARMGAVVTRFPPEPSGYLHIGHAKAAMLNEYFARHYQGKLILRFDDTNPSKEKDEFESSILEDLGVLGIRPDLQTHTSDYFDRLADIARQLIAEGKAYADNTPKEKMSQERFEGIPSACRDLPPAQSLAIFEAMQQGQQTDWCIRAKIDMSAPNKALRDPVIYRCNLTPHHRTGERYKAYPTYDFACPIVDSIEGVTHALRTDEYHDRNDQYRWIAQAAGLVPSHVWDYSRLNFVYTLLSKRKLNWFVQQGVVSGWDDPRFPTVRGILRRGLTVAALREYILMQGASKNALLLEWDKIWAVNKRIIDPVAPRHVALVKDGLVQVRLVQEGDKAVEPALTGSPITRDLPRHKKNPDLGMKRTNFGPIIFIEGADAGDLAVNEEITLMDWGNAIIREIRREADGQIVGMTAALHLDGSVKTTERKLTWLASDPLPLVTAILHDYDYLICKRRLEESDELADHLTPQTEYVQAALGDPGLAGLRKGEVVQLERKGFYICDQSYDPSSSKTVVHLIAIPDGKAKTTASKHQ